MPAVMPASIWAAASTGQAGAAALAARASAITAVVATSTGRAPNRSTAVDRNSAETAVAAP